MVADGVQRVLEARHGPDNDSPHHGMLADGLELLPRQTARLAEDGVWDADLAHIMEQGSHGDPLLRGVIKAQILRDLQAVGQHVF